MKPKLLLVLVFVLSGGLFCCFGATGTTQTRLEEMARTNSHFSLAMVIYNQETELGLTMEQFKPTIGAHPSGRLYPSNPLALEQLQLLKELRELSGDYNTLTAQLKNPDPKIRTLALGAIFQREDGRDLPLIASLINDSAPTFPDLHGSRWSMSDSGPVSPAENPQTVGDVTRNMLFYWGVTNNATPYEASKITTNDFANYWKRYVGRKFSASWFRVKMERATRQVSPIQPEYRPDVERVFAEMQALPMPDRVWTQLYVLTPGWWSEIDPKALLVTDGELISIIKQLGPVALLHFLQRLKVSSDPDLQMDRDNPCFQGMSEFILKHADVLLRADDADALLACAYVERSSRGINPAWAVGVSLVQPNRAGDILHTALALQTNSSQAAASMLAGALWRIRGPLETDFLVQWFYTDNPAGWKNVDGIDPQQAFLWEVASAVRPDTKQLMAALIKDSRFDRSNESILREMLRIANAERATPLATKGNALETDGRLLFAATRTQLRHEYGVPEKPLPALEANPKQVLTQSVWSVALEDRPQFLVSSPDGRSLALLSRQWFGMTTNQSVTVWNASTGELRCQMLHNPTAEMLNLAFEPDGELLMGFADGRFTAWSIAASRPGILALAEDMPTVIGDEGKCCFAQAGRIVACLGIRGFGCFDTQSGQARWTHHGGTRAGLALSADGKRLALGGGWDYPLGARLFDAESGTLLRHFDRHASEVLALALSGDGSQVVTATSAEGIQLWDAATGKCLQEYAWRVPYSTAPYGLTAPVFSPDGEWLAVVGTSANILENSVGVFSVRSGELVWKIQLKTGRGIDSAVPLAFSTDGKFLYTAASRLEAWRLK